VSYRSQISRATRRQRKDRDYQKATISPSTRTTLRRASGCIVSMSMMSATVGLSPRGASGHVRSPPLDWSFTQSHWDASLSHEGRTIRGRHLPKVYGGAGHVLLTVSEEEEDEPRHQKHQHDRDNPYPR
jgi:hypothetical protein